MEMIDVFNEEIVRFYRNIKKHLNSALAGLMPARKVETEALYAVRGKVKNALKSSLSECLKNAEVNDIISILGCGIKDNYDGSKLNYGKVAISVDAD